MRLAWCVLLLGACANDLPLPWDLDHDHLVAIRATPPHVPSGTTSKLDALVAHEGAMTSIDTPMVAAAIQPPPSLANVVAVDGTITAPDEATLAQARTELMLMPTDPVPLFVGVTIDGLAGTKDVTLGDSGDNPAMGDVTVDGAPAGETDLAIAPNVDVQLDVSADDMDKVNWSTSCGTMHDDDEHHAFVHVEPSDPQSGELAVVVRTPDGGVVFRTWTIHAP